MGETGVEQHWEKGYCPLQLFIRGCAYGVTLSNTPRSVAGCFVKTMGSYIKDFHTEREVSEKWTNAHMGKGVFKLRLAAWRSG